MIEIPIEVEEISEECVSGFLEASDFIIGFALDEDNAIQYKIEFYELESMTLVEDGYQGTIIKLNEWNDEEKIINEEFGKNYKKCEIINKYGYGIIVNVGNTLFTAYGYEEDLKK